jgi:hypothetical protein
LTALRLNRVDEVRVRYVEAMFARGRRSQIAALADSVRDVPALVAELVVLRRVYADLVAACRAGLLARRDGETDAACWSYVTSELPSPPPGHPLHDDPATDPTGPAGGGHHG